jgi:hypothetical protein
MIIAPAASTRDHLKDDRNHQSAAIIMFAEARLALF